MSVVTRGSPQLPIDVIPGTTPPKFCWTQVVESINGTSVVDCEGLLPPSAEKAIVDLIHMTKDLLRENADLREKAELFSRGGRDLASQVNPPMKKEKVGK